MAKQMNAILIIHKNKGHGKNSTWRFEEELYWLESIIMWDCQTQIAKFRTIVEVNNLPYLPPL